MVSTLAHAARADPHSCPAAYVLFDLLGSGSLPVPLIGDLFDVATAPVSALLLHGIFRAVRVTGVLLLEDERLPATDVLASGTLAFLAQEAGWLKENGMGVDYELRKATWEVVEKGLVSFNEGLRVSGGGDSGGGGRGRRARRRGTARQGFWSCLLKYGVGVIFVCI